MKKQNIFLFIILAAVIGTGIFFWAKNRMSQPPAGLEHSSTPSGIRPSEYFTGDHGVLLKGTLLDSDLKNEYDALPDTLAQLQFGDQLFCANCEPEPQPTEAALTVSEVAGQEKAHGYSLFPQKATVSDIEKENKTINPRLSNLLKYLKLAEQGKANFPRFAFTAKNSSAGMLDNSSFSSKYGSHFSFSYLEAIPYEIKEVLIEFFNTEEGKEFDFITNDQRDHGALIRQGSFTGKNKAELACVVGTKDDVQTRHREKVLVFAYNREGRMYIIYTEDFDDKILLETIYPDPEERWDHRVYQGGEEKQELPFDGIRIRQSNQPDIVLAYNQQFDKMNRFIQTPASHRSGQEGEE